MNEYAFLIAVGIVLFVSAIISKLVITPILKEEYIKNATPDITEDEMSQLEENLSCFLKENNLKPGDSIWEVADVLNVVDSGAVDNISARARIYESDTTGAFKVVHHKKVPDNERLFDFAHELGHRINKDPLPADRPHGYNKPKQDQLADYTGAALLMPLEHVYDFLIKNNYDSASSRKRVFLIRKLSKKYNVSEILAVRRVNEVRLLKKLSIR